MPPFNPRSRKGGGRMTKLDPTADRWLRVENVRGDLCARAAIACQISGAQVPLHVQLWLSAKSDGVGLVADYATRVISHFSAGGQIAQEAA